MTSEKETPHGVWGEVFIQCGWGGIVGVSGEGRDEMVLTSDVGGVTAHMVTPCLSLLSRV